jgi:hypothetical protein
MSTNSQGALGTHAYKPAQETTHSARLGYDKAEVDFNSVVCAEKARATLAAQLALAGGFMLHELASGAYLVSGQNVARQFPSLAAVGHFVEQIGGAS